MALNFDYAERPWEEHRYRAQVVSWREGPFFYNREEGSR